MAKKTKLPLKFSKRCFLFYNRSINRSKQICSFNEIKFIVAINDIWTSMSSDKSSKTLIRSTALADKNINNSRCIGRFTAQVCKTIYAFTSPFITKDPARAAPFSLNIGASFILSSDNGTCGICRLLNNIFYILRHIFHYLRISSAELCKHTPRESSFFYPFQCASICAEIFFNVLKFQAFFSKFN